MPAVRTKTSRTKVQKQRETAGSGVGTSKGSNSATVPQQSTLNANVGAQPSGSRPSSSQSERAHGKKPYAPPAKGSKRPTPLRLGDLEYVSMLGDGSFGFVSTVRVMRKASRKHKLDRIGAQFALKAITATQTRETEMNQWMKNYATDEEQLQAIRETMQIRDAEREALTGLPWHPFVSGLVDTFHDHRNYYLLMELAPCQSFDAFLTKHGPLRSEDARFYFANLTLALEFLHTHGVIHRDLKPQNILMGADGYFMIGDFGVSAHITDGNNWKNVGTYPYTAPEFYGETHDTRVVPPILRMAGDWWAAAVILFQMVTLDWPFNEPSEELLYKRIMCSKPGEFWERDEFQDLYIDPELKDLVNMMLMRDVASRYGTIAVKAPGDKLARNDEVRIHPFMHGKVDWIRMNHRLVIPPFVPDRYPDLLQQVQKHSLGEDQKIPGIGAEYKWPIELKYNLWNKIHEE
ncbi:hypothetical protein EVJ58_g6075 [Rhodofomes roseus]|uniref:cAMP-dependent protein kinase n=1 Tax=Rhodofomes roseus TaxID=34475 RepID=A0A4Y9YBK4_9APHY|nr:hypothetical protein EVJ58_g6075 [Rhodofomes roseus]